MLSPLKRLGNGPTEKEPIRLTRDNDPCIKSAACFMFEPLCAWAIKNVDKDTTKREVGFIAQEVEEIIPEIVITRDNGYKAVQYEKIVALLIEANKELKERVEKLENKQ